MSKAWERAMAFLDQWAEPEPDEEDDEARVLREAS